MYQAIGLPESLRNETDTRVALIRKIYELNTNILFFLHPADIYFFELFIIYIHPYLYKISFHGIHTYWLDPTCVLERW